MHTLDVVKMTISIAEAERAEVEALARRLSVRPSRAFALAVKHTLRTLERGEPFRAFDEPPEEERR